MQRPFDAIIFDLGDTLLYFNGDLFQVLAEAYRELYQCLNKGGIVVDQSWFLSEFKIRMDEYFRTRETDFIEYTTYYVLKTLLMDIGYPGATRELIENAVRAMYQVTEAYWLPEPDIYETLAILRSHGYRLGMLSNASDDANVQALVDKAGIRHFFDRIVTSAEYGIRKPNPRIFQVLMEAIGVPAARTAIVGDTLGADILGAKNVGSCSIWITRRANTPANNAHRNTISPDYQISSLSELVELLERISV